MALLEALSIVVVSAAVEAVVESDFAQVVASLTVAAFGAAAVPEVVAVLEAVAAAVSLLVIVAVPVFQSPTFAVAISFVVVAEPTSRPRVVAAAIAAVVVAPIAVDAVAEPFSPLLIAFVVLDVEPTWRFPIA